jgi:hypothetical protein
MFAFSKISGELARKIAVRPEWGGLKGRFSAFRAILCRPFQGLA